MDSALLKKRRTVALGTFTRNEKSLIQMIDTNSPKHIAVPQYEKLQACWNKLEESHDAYVESIDGEIDEDSDDFKKLDEPYVRYQTAVQRYSEYFTAADTAERAVVQQKEQSDRVAEEALRKQLENEKKVAAEELQKQDIAERFSSTKLELETGIDVFNRFIKNVEESVVGVSTSVKYTELGKVETEFNLLKSLLVKFTGIDVNEDITETKTKFTAAENVYLTFYKKITSELKDLDIHLSTSGGSTSGSSGGNSSSNGGNSSTSGGGNSSNTKSEPVDLPVFKGDESMSPFVKFPTWKSQWDVLILDYEEKHRWRMLEKKLDEAARAKFIGYEGKYEEAMERLTKYYGNRDKVVKHVLQEVLKPKSISEGDYKHLIEYSVTLENNYSRLTSMNMEHEMSNTSTMSYIVNKFPRSVREKWHACLLQKSEEERSKPFPIFILWLISEKDIWECMVSADVDELTKSSFFVKDISNVDDQKCFGCGESGHKRRNCPSNNKNNRDNRDNRDNTTTKAQPKVKKFWCALHKDDKSRRCNTNNCNDLRKMTDIPARIRLVKENGDCTFCCGDHKPADCHFKERVCGGGKENRGCSKNHKMHEIFCSEAKLCMLVTMSVEEDKMNVVLCIMRVPAPRGLTASVFWDSGSQSNFITEQFAKQCGFKGKLETLSVTTLGGIVTEFLTVTEYNCELKDTNGQMVKFKAYGMECITGSVSKVGFQKLRKLFPHLSNKMIHKLERTDKVDVLIGLAHPSMHPERTVQAKGDGDFWIYEGQFGSCVGGRHPQLKEGTCRSNDLFTVNHYTQISASNTMPHELQYCPLRCEVPYNMSKSRVQSKISISNPTVESESEIPSIPQTDQIDTVSVNSISFAESIKNEVCAQTDHISCECVGDHIQVVQVSASDSSDSSLDSTLSAISSPPSSNVDSTITNTNTDISNSDVAKGLNVNALTFTPGSEWKSSSASVKCCAALTCPMDEDSFFRAESLGTVVEPQCGGCRCNHCPIPGSQFSFKEQREFNTIQKLLFYDMEKKRWFTSYPFKCDRSVLPRNDKSAFKQLHSLEKSLLKNPALASEYCQQIQNMLDRGAAKVLSKEELNQWEGDYHYLPIVGVKTKGKPFRVCFDFARKQCGAPSFNDCLYKGPDRYVNNLLTVILGFRNGRVGCVADISKFHNQVHLVEEDVHMQRFLWRNMQTEEEPKVYCATSNAFGATPANCIATCALRNSADKFANVYPIESEEIKHQIYIDDELTAANGMEEALEKTRRWDEITAHASMPNKGWTFSGDDSSDVPIGCELGVDKVLGLAWDPKSDDFLYHVKLKVKLQKSIEVIEITSVEELLKYRESILTRRMLQSNIMSIFDPLGNLLPVTMQSRLLMRESYTCPKPLGWDDQLPEDQGERWIEFLSALLSLGELRFPRSLWPDQEVVGLPILIVFSDGALLAYGTAAYIRWELKSGGFWVRLIMAKCKIAPKNILSVNRMELNGAAMNDRVKNFILKDTNMKFEQVFQFVDSSTVLGYLHKEGGVYKPYEGIRVSEIQSRNVFENGHLKGWAWVAGSDNPADLCTKPRQVKDLKPGSFWQKASGFLELEIPKWPIKYTFRTDRLDGEIVIGKSLHVSVINVANPDLLGRIVHRVGSWKKMIRILAWILRMGTPYAPPTAKQLQHAKQLLLKFAQKEIVNDLKQAADTGKGRFRRLAPTIDDDGIWRVGSRIRQHVPFTFDSKLPIILPTKHLITLHIMRMSHNHSHVASDGTLCRFRMEGFWAVRAGVIAKKVADACVDCRKKSGKTLSQPLGEIPADQLKQPMAWGHCQMDLFGPYHCRSDVKARCTKKTWGMVIEDVNSGAVHLDVLSDYSTDSVLLTLRRFGSVRGWPTQMRSDPGSQLESASGKLENWWSSFGESLQSLSGSKNFEWILSPPDSPWRQGKAERRIGVIKDLLRVSVGDTRVTPLELQTIFMEISNICNERPIGLSKPHTDSSYTVLTPNHLLMGRSSNILPDDAQLSEDLPYACRYRLINHVTTIFWNKWCSEVTPRLVFRQKWHEKTRNLRVDDVVMICDSSPIKAKYKLAIVEQVHTSDDGAVRSATVRYTNVHSERSSSVRVKRSVQRLVLKRNRTVLWK